MSSKMMVDYALEYADKLGWMIFPTIERGGRMYWDKNGRQKETKPKAPYIPNGFMDATNDPETIKSWWAKWPYAGIGLACGLSGLVVIDIDTKDGRCGFQNFYNLGIDDEGALKATTPSGGMHIIYKGTCKSSANAIKGVDVRSTGAYIVLPPSVLYHRDGTEIGRYVATSDWFDDFDSVPTFTDDSFSKLELLRDRKLQDRKPKEIKPQSHNEKVERARVALNRLAERHPKFAYDYFRWIEIGMSLHSLGEDGYGLWVEWSQTCPEKFDLSACEEKWETLNPKDITIGSLFYYAWEYEGEEL